MAVSERWQWSISRKRYLYAKNGHAVPVKRIDSLRHRFALTQQAYGEDAAAQVAAGHWTAQRWELETRERVKRAYLNEYMLGRGGRNVMTQADFGTVGRMLKDQYGYLRGFTQAMIDGELSEAQIAARTQLYFEGATYAHERGRQAAYGSLRLPAYPGDHGTPCRSRCHCRWEIHEAKKQWRCFWRTSSGETCTGCVDRRARYNPFIQRRSTE
jgi:hypothetical protein